MPLTAPFAVGANTTLTWTDAPGSRLMPSGSATGAANGSSGAIARVIVSGTVPRLETVSTALRDRPTGTVPKSIRRASTASSDRPLRAAPSSGTLIEPRSVLDAQP